MAPYPRAVAAVPVAWVKKPTAVENRWVLVVADTPIAKEPVPVEVALPVASPAMGGSAITG